MMNGTSTGRSTTNDISSIQNKDGIDIRLALDILSQRSVTESMYTSNNNNNHRSNNKSNSENTIQPAGCSCCRTPTSSTGPLRTKINTNDNDDMKRWGQVIDLATIATKEDDDVGTATENDAPTTTNITTTATTKPTFEEERTKRKSDIECTIRSMSIRQQIHCILESQQQRVVTYTKYNRGLEQVLQTGNVSYYPTICAEATASFAVLSDTINVVQNVLNEMNNTKCNSNSNNNNNNSIHNSVNNYLPAELVQLIGKLQFYESTKLSLTAALHLERIREQQQQCNDEGMERGPSLQLPLVNTNKSSSSSGSSSSTIIGDGSIDDNNNSRSNYNETSLKLQQHHQKQELVLLRQSIKSLQNQIKKCIEHINDTIEELHCTLVDTDDL